MKNIKRKSIKKIILITLASMLIAGILTYTILRENSLKKFNAEFLLSPRISVTIWDGDGAEIDNTLNNEITVSSLLPSHLKNAIISIEDKKFYSHHGVDYKRIAGAMLKNIKNRKIVQGGSTITQQLIKNTHLNNEKKISRKINEYFLAKKIEKLYSKDDILNMYMNILYYGNGTYGVANASKLFFAKSYTELNIEESATLAAVLNSPRLYSPLNAPEKALERRNLVINEMYKDGKISLEEYNSALNSPMNLSKKFEKMSDTDINNIYCRAALAEACELVSNLENCRIYTNYNESSQRALYNSMHNESYYYPDVNGVLPDAQGIIMNNNSGKIEAYYTTNISLKNLKRQPASTIKPILVYAPAIEKGIITPATQILDEEINYNGYSPKNHNNTFSGFVSARYALSNSLNVPAVKIFDYTGIDYCKNFAAKAGVKFDKKDNSYALSLGGFTEGLTLTEIANTYQCIANKGIYIRAGLVEKITDDKNNIIYERDKKNITVMHEDTAYLTTDMLKTSVKEGTASRLNILNLPLAAKTGTTGSNSGNSDAYCIAFTKDRTFAVWQGDLNYQNKMDLKVKGSSYPTMQVRDMLKEKYKDKHPDDFNRPLNIIKIKIDQDELTKNQLLIEADSNTKSTISELFSERHLPKKRSEKNNTEKIYTAPGKNKKKNYLEIILELFKFRALS